MEVPLAAYPIYEEFELDFAWVPLADSVAAAYVAASFEEAELYFPEVPLAQMPQTGLADNRTLMLGGLGVSAISLIGALFLMFRKRQTM